MYAYTMYYEWIKMIADIKNTFTVIISHYQISRPSYRPRQHPKFHNVCQYQLKVVAEDSNAHAISDKSDFNSP